MGKRATDRPLRRGDGASRDEAESAHASEAGRSRRAGERAGLTHDTVLAAARDLLAEAGLSGLTMRALARRLAVAPNALYSHVASKSALVDALLDDHLGAVPVPDTAAPDARAALAALMTATYDTLLARPDLVGLYLARSGARGENAVALGAAMDVLLARAGTAEDQIRDARRTLIVHAIGSAAFATSSDNEPPEWARTTFTAGLTWLLAGIAA